MHARVLADMVHTTRPVRVVEATDVPDKEVPGVRLQVRQDRCRLIA